jgi:hypothetical protein
MTQEPHQSKNQIPMPEDFPIPPTRAGGDRAMHPGVDVVRRWQRPSMGSACRSRPRNRPP